MTGHTAYKQPAKRKMLEVLPESLDADPSRLDDVLGPLHLDLIADVTYEPYAEHGNASRS